MENIITHFWDRNKIVFKSFWIGFLLLLLLIPTAFIRDLVSERQLRQQTAVTEINSRWAGAQTVTGPVIGIPSVRFIPCNIFWWDSRFAFSIPCCCHSRNTQASMRHMALPPSQYGFIFTLLQLQDYALLLGSVGLFITVALVMYFSRKIKWN
jgi:inner membrane protein involved in colicin E2 resistance